MPIALTRLAGGAVGGSHCNLRIGLTEPEAPPSLSIFPSMPSGSCSRFFVLKSVGKSVVRNSMVDGSYSVQTLVGVRLNRAFVKTRGHVFLIFSTKKSKSFQALGKMRASATLEPNGRRFRFWVEWLTDFVHLPFSEVEDIKQRSDSQFSVTASQDGQEIGCWAGRRLASLLLVAAPPIHFLKGESDPLEEEESPETYQNQETWDLLRPPSQLERFKEYPATVQPQMGTGTPLVWNQLQFSVDLNKSLGESFFGIATK